MTAAVSRTGVIEHVEDLRRRPGTRRPLHRTMRARGLGVSGSHVPDAADVSIDGVLESIADGVVVDATLHVPWVGACRRCLDDVEGTATAEVREIFESHPTDGDTWPLHGHTLDLAPLLHDTVLLTLPLAPLCSEGCRGPAPHTFPAIAEPDAADLIGHEDGPAPRDPRWAALDQLRTE